MKPPNLWWSEEIAREMGDDPIAGLIHGDTNGLFVFHLAHWAKLAQLPPDAVELVSLDGLNDIKPVEDVRDWADEPNPRPWRLSGGQGIGIVDANGERVGWMAPASLAYATVRAVNRLGTRCVGISRGAASPVLPSGGQQ